MLFQFDVLCCHMMNWCMFMLSAFLERLTVGRSQKHSNIDNASGALVWSSVIPCGHHAILHFHLAIMRFSLSVWLFLSVSRTVVLPRRLNVWEHWKVFTFHLLIFQVYQFLHIVDATLYIHWCDDLICFLDVGNAIARRVPLLFLNDRTHLHISSHSSLL